MKIALAQINPIIGDIPANTDWILDAMKQAADAECGAIFFSELAVTGYLPEDLLQNKGVLDAEEQALDTIRRLSGACAVFIGHTRRNTGTGKPLFNCVSVFRNGQCIATVRKRLLPNYDVFNENRYFEPGEQPAVIDLDGTRFGVTVCEDGWNTPFSNAPELYDDDPIADCVKAGADVIVNIAASPFTYMKVAFREEMFGKIAAHHGKPLIMTNQAGGVDGVIFDGMSAAFDAQGQLSARCRSFEADICILEMGKPADPLPVTDHADNRLIHDALVCGIRDFIRKIGATQIHLGLSGGIDSALVAVLAAHALGPENVTGIMLPSRCSSEGSLTDARELVQLTGIRSLEIPIQAGVDEAMARLESEVDTIRSITEENLQARMRGLLLMGWSNNENAILLNTGNKSELAVGYATIYGDMCGALAVIGDVYKTRVFQLCRWINDTYGYRIPTAIIEKPPSAELKPDQKDTDSLPPYDQLDSILECFVEKGMAAEDIVVRTGLDAALVRHIIGMVLRTEFKRKQGAPVLKVTDRAFGSGFRFPISSKFNP